MASSARGVTVKVFIVCVLALGSLRERSEPFPALVHPTTETATRGPCDAAFLFFGQRYRAMSDATRFVSSPMMIPRPGSPDSFKETPKAAPIRT